MRLKQIENETKALKIEKPYRSPGKNIQRRELASSDWRSEKRLMNLRIKL